jgi:small subunit ribosomal protein S15
MVNSVKKEVISEFAAHEKDTGSTGVQIAILSKRINKLAEHLKQNRKDFHSMRGLLLMVGKRRRLMKYLKNDNFEKFQEVIGKLNLKDKV